MLHFLNRRIFFYTQKPIFRHSTLVEISSELVEISSKLVEISSELVEISSELVEISSETFSKDSELLIISVFIESRKSVWRTMMLPFNDSKCDKQAFSFVKYLLKPLWALQAAKRVPI